uniref:tape measure protein n=1 Tax=Acinetobacter gerneri TaxID=202952 RepID=UPI0028A9A8BF
MAESVLRITIDSRQALINAQAVNKELQSIDKTGDFASKSMDSLSVATRTLAGHMAGLVTVGAAVSKMDAYTGLQNRLKLVTNSQVELNKAMGDTFAIAQKTRQSWESAAQVYQGFANNAKTLGLTMAQTAQLTETVSKAVAISGGSAASSEAALIQFNQALGAGALRGEELNSVMEQTPGLAKAIAEGMGITVGQLRTVAAQGKITSEELVKALTKAKSSVDDLFSKTDITIGQSITLLNNELSKFVGEAGQSSGAAKTLAESIQVLSQNIDLATNAVMIGGAYWAGTYIPTLYKGIATTISKTSAVFADIKAQQLAAEIDAQRTSRIAHLTSVELANAEVQALRLTGMQRLAYIESTVIPLRVASTAATEADTVAQNANNVSKITASRVGAGLLSVLGGAGGLAGIAVAVGASMLLMSRDTDTATNSLDIQKKTVKELADEYSKMSMNKLISEMDVLSEKSQKAKNEANNALNKARSVAPVVGDFGTEKQREQNKLLNDTIDKLKAGSLDAAKALQELRKGGFSKDQVEDARRAFAAYEDNDNVLRLVNYQMALVNSYLDKSSGLYEKTTDKIADLTKQSNLLSESYSNSKDSVVKAAETLLQIGENSGASAQQLEIARNALNSYGKGAITASQLAQVFQKNLPIPEESINSFIKQSQQSDAYKKSMVNVNAELKKQNDLRDAFQKQHKGILDAKQAETEEDSKQLTIRQKLNKLEETYAQKNLNTDFKLINIKSHGLDMGNALDEFYDANKIPKTRSLTNDEWAVFKKWFDKNQELKKLEDDITESKKKQTKELKEQYKYRQAEEKLLAKAYSDVSKSGLGAYAESKGIPANVIAGLYMQESKAGTDLRSHTGALGPWQTTSGYRKDNQISMADNNDFLKVGKIVVDNIAKEFAKSGSLKQAILSHNAGSAGAAQFMANGSVNGKSARRAEVAGYLPKIDKWAAWGSGKKGGLLDSNSSGKDYQDLLKDQIKFEEKSKDIELSYADAKTKRLNDHEKRLSDLKIHFSGETYAKLERQENERYANENRLADLQFDQQLNG